jgi:hypothetical protein
MTTYTYAMKGGYQHLVKDGVALCGETSERWRMKTTPGCFTGVSLCTDCAAERTRRAKAEKQAAKDAQAAQVAEIKTYWLRSKAS